MPACARAASDALGELVAEICGCRVCAHALPHDPRPVVRVSAEARVLIAGQAPGRRVHETGLPFNDPSGDRLRDWMGIDRDTFYDQSKIAVAAMGFCYPGTVNGADLPPRRECAPLWRTRLMALLPNIRLTLLVGTYAIAWHLKAKAPLADIVGDWRKHGVLMPLPHPSWRNTGWLKRHPWFERDLLPDLRARVREALD